MKLVVCFISLARETHNSFHKYHKHGKTFIPDLILMMLSQALNLQYYLSRRNKLQPSFNKRWAREDKQYKEKLNDRHKHSHQEHQKESQRSWR